MTILKTVSFFMVILGGLKIESFRFEDYDDDNDVKCSSKGDQPSQNVLQFSIRPGKLD